MLMTSAAVAVTLAIPDKRKRFLLITTIFLYTTVVNIIERPEGIKIAAWFIVTIIGSSLVSRVMRSTEIRIEGVRYDEAATRFVEEEAAGRKSVRIIASRPNMGRARRSTRASCSDAKRLASPARATMCLCSSRSARVDASDFGRCLSMCTASTIGRLPGAPVHEPGDSLTRSRALLLDLRDRTGLPFLTRTLAGPRGTYCVPV